MTDLDLGFALTFWQWWILGALLLGLELMAPGIFFLWVGLAAGLTGAVVLVLPGLGWELQVLGFAALAVAVTMAGRWWWSTRGGTTGDPTLNQRAASLIGSTCVLVTDLAHGHGRAQVGDSTWTVTGPDMPADTPVTITGVRGTVLIVERANP